MLIAGGFSFGASNTQQGSGFQFGAGNQQSSTSQQPKAGFNFGSSTSQNSSGMLVCGSGIVLSLCQLVFVLGVGGGFAFGKNSSGQDKGVFQFGAGGSQQGNDNSSSGVPPSTGFNFGASTTPSFNFT